MVPESNSKSDQEAQRQQNMKYDSSTGKLYEELGCPNNNNASSASAGATAGSSSMDTSQSSVVPTTSTSTTTGMSQTQQMHTDYYQNYQHAYPYSSQVGFYYIQFLIN